VSTIGRDGFFIADIFILKQRNFVFEKTTEIQKPLVLGVLSDSNFPLPLVFGM